MGPFFSFFFYLWPGAPNTPLSTVETPLLSSFHLNVVSCRPLRFPLLIPFSPLLFLCVMSTDRLFTCRDTDEGTDSDDNCRTNKSSTKKRIICTSKSCTLQVQIESACETPNRWHICTAFYSLSADKLSDFYQNTGKKPSFDMFAAFR